MQNDMFLVVFWLLSVVTALWKVEDASLGTLKSSISSQSEAVYSSKIWGLVELWNT